MAGAPIIMPKLGLTMSEGLIAEWRVRPGEDVVAGQILFVVETDKISNEIEAAASGRIIQLLAAEGETAQVGAAVALWTGPGPAQSDAPPPRHATAVEAEPGVRVKATPLARRLARQGGLEIHAVAGTGPRGRVQARDVHAALGQIGRNPPEAPSSAPPMPAAAPAAPDRSLSRDLRPLIAARVTRSNTEVPHFYVSADAKFDELAALRSQLNADPAAPRQLSITSLLGMAAARALIVHPMANAVWREGRAAPLERVTVAVAVETPAGVVAPVVPADGSLYEFAAALEAAVMRARAGRMTMADAGSAALGLSNVGMFGVRTLTPIIDPEQSFMLGVGAPWTAFQPDDRGTPTVVRSITVTLACDHRLIDGAPAARFLSEVVNAIERPLRLLM